MMNMETRTAHNTKGRAGDTATVTAVRKKAAAMVSGVIYGHYGIFHAIRTGDDKK